MFRITLISVFSAYIVIAAPMQLDAQELSPERCTELKGKQEGGSTLSEEEMREMVRCLEEISDTPSPHCGVLDIGCGVFGPQEPTQVPPGQMDTETIEDNSGNSE